MSDWEGTHTTNPMDNQEPVMNQPKTEEETVDLTLDRIFVLANTAEDQTTPSIDLDKVIKAAFTEVEVERSTSAAWRHQVDEESIDSMSASIDTDLNGVPSDRYAVDLCDRIRENVSSLSIVWVGHRLRRAAFTVHTALVRFFKWRGASAIVSVAVIAGVFVLFAPLPGNDSPFLSLPTFAGPAVHIGEDGAGVGNEEEGNTGIGNDNHSVALPGAGHVGQGNDPRPGQDLGQPLPGKGPPPGKEPPPGKRAPGQPSFDSPGVQEERTVELSTQAGQESVEIDWWRQVGDKSGDLQMNENMINTVLGAKLSVIEASPEPTYDRCAQVQTWTTQVDLTTLYAGSQLCAQSQGGRYAMLRVTALPWSPGSDGRFVFYGRTWQLPS